MMTSDQYTIITAEEQLREYLARLRRRNVGKIALDMEGDQGMFRYKYAVSILQCFDGEEAVVIDTLKMGANDTLREFLTCQDIIKVMFSCGNDVFMAQNVLGCTISPINDISIAQKLLGHETSLVGYLDIDKDRKDSFQRANWLLRPIKPILLEYAVNDVLQLLDIENDLAEQLAGTPLYDAYIKGSRAASDKNYRSNPHELFKTKFPGYLRMPYEKRKIAAALWIFRELWGEKFDCPVGYLLSKKSLANVINNSDGDIITALEREINRNRKPSKRMSESFIRDLFSKASESPHIPPEPDPEEVKRVRRRRRGGNY